MIYINGIGYPNEASYQAASAINVTNQKNDETVSSVRPDSFDAILKTETANLQGNEVKTKSLKDIFAEASETYHVSQKLLEAIAYHESRFRPDVTSASGAMGIMQLMPATAKAMGVENAYDPYENIMGAAKLLGQLSDLYNGNETLMIAAYNAGSGNVAKYGGVPPFKNVQNYVAKVLSTMEQGVLVPDTEVETAASSKSSKTPSASAASAAVDSTSHSDKKDVSGSKEVSDQTNFYDSSRLNELFSYEDYELFMKYFEQMLQIISNIGNTEDTKDEDSDEEFSNEFFWSGTNPNLFQQISQINPISQTSLISQASLINQTTPVSQANQVSQTNRTRAGKAVSAYVSGSGNDLPVR